MILARMLSYITCNKWSIVQFSPHTIHLVNRSDPAKYIKVKKNTETGAISVSMPLSQAAERVAIRFGSEMHAYEYLENIIMDDGEDREQHNRDMNQRSIGVKRKRQLICETHAKASKLVYV